MTEIKDKIQEMFSELQNLREEVVAGRSGRQDDSSEVNEEGNTKATPSNIFFTFGLFLVTECSLIFASPY